MTAQHTPGPWSLADVPMTSGGIGVHGPDPKWQHPLCVVKPAPDQNLLGNAGEANARLIAAAPELLEAHDPDLLDDLADDLDRGASPSRQSEIADDLRELVAAIRAAIAKAKGGEA